MVHTLNDVFARSEVKPSVFPAIMSLAFQKINVTIFWENWLDWVAQSMVSFNHWLSSIKTNTLSRYLKKRWLTLTMLRTTGPWTYILMCVLIVRNKKSVVRLRFENDVRVWRSVLISLPHQNIRMTSSWRVMCAHKTDRKPMRRRLRTGNQPLRR